MPINKTAAQLRQARASIMRVAIIICALIFLYLPIVTLIIYSFNESRMVTVWTETSLKWYYALFSNSAIIHAVGISLLIAFMTACAAVVIGTLAAFVLVRVGRFKGESLFVLLITAPMVLPDVITGLALLLIFVTLGAEIPFFAHRGVFAIWVAHVTFCSAYTTVVIRSRFRELDISIEEAAKDLGAGPIKVFFAVILPALMPAEVAAFLLAFTMSMDDLVVASFIAGPDSTTLPMLIFSSVRRGLSPEINALATIIVLIVSICTFFAWLSMVKKQKRIKSDAAKAAAAQAIEQKMHYTAPHGDESLDLNNLSAEALALFKEQAAALQRGEDIADETKRKLQALIASRQSQAKAQAQAAAQTTAAATAAAAANNATAPAAKATASTATTATNSTLSGAAVSAASLATAANSTTPAKASSTVATATGTVSRIRGEVLGEPAKDATARQRQASDNAVKAGKVRVLDAQSAGINPRIPVDTEELEESANDKAQSQVNESKSAEKSKRSKVLAPQATTKSSLEQAIAKKVASRNAIDHALEQAQYENESLPVTEESKRPARFEEGSGSGLNQNRAPKATTQSSLEQAKAKKQKAAASQSSAIAATAQRTQKAKAESSKAKVVDTTKNED